MSIAANESGSARYWIIAAKEEREYLEKLGVVVGEYVEDDDSGEFHDCVISPAAAARLDPLWGDFFWGRMLGSKP